MSFLEKTYKMATLSTTKHVDIQKDIHLFDDVFKRDDDQYPHETFLISNSTSDMNPKSDADYEKAKLGRSQRAKAAKK